MCPMELTGRSIEASTANGNPLPRLLTCGVDSLYVSFFVDPSSGTLDWADLEYRKERLRQGEGAEFAEIKIGSETFALRPYGRKPYRIILANEAMEVRLSETVRPACHIQFLSKGLWEFGVEAMFGRAKTWCESVGLRHTQPEVISRVDWAFDYDFDVAQLKPDQFLSRARKDGSWRENKSVQTLQFGTGDIVLRVYDKVAEIEQQSLKSWFYEIWGTFTNVTRVEFQVRGDRLRQGGIRTIQDLADFQGDLLRELVQNHSSLRIPNEDSNSSRWPVHPLWQALHSDIDRLSQTGLARCFDVASSAEWRRRKILQSIYGNTKQIGALTRFMQKGHPTVSFEHILAIITQGLKNEHDEETWTVEVESRLAALRLGQ